MPMGIGPGLSVTRGGSVTGIGAIGADLAMWFDENQAYKSSGGGIVTPDSILTYTAPSPKLVYGSDGVLRYANHNRFFPSADFTTTWTQTGVSVAADVITCTAGGTNHRVSRNTSVAGSQRVFFDVKEGTHSFVQIYDGANSENYATFNLSTGERGAVGTNTTATITDIGGGYYRCAVTYSAAGAPNGNSFLAFASSAAAAWGSTFSATGAETISVLRAQLQSAPAPTDFTYIATTTAAVYSLPRDYNPTTSAALGVLVEEARTNLCLYSNDFTNAAWVKVNVTPAKTATGPDGVANSASTLTATLANGTVLQTIISASAVRVTSMFVKRRTGTGAIEMTQDNGVSWTAVTVTANWTRVSVPSATILNPIVGVRIVTSGDAIDVALFQIENGAFITSPIPTVASQVTRAADQISILTSAFPYSATEGTLAVVARPILANSLGAAASLNDGTGNEEIVLYRDASGNIVYQVEDGGANQLDPLDSGQNAANLTEYKMAAAWAANDFATAVGGNAAVTDTSGTLPTVTTLEVGVNQANNYVNGHIKRLDYYAVRKSNAELQVLST